MEENDRGEAGVPEPDRGQNDTDPAPQGEKKDTGSRDPAKPAGAIRFVLSFLPRLWSNWLSLAGTVITTVSGCTIVLAVAAQMVAPSPKPYTSALAFLVMPAVFLFGLVLIPLGLWWERRRKDRPLDPIQAAFREAIQNRSARRRIVFFGIFTFLNIVIIGAAGHRALVFMDSTDFCGKLCHSVMEPEYNAYLRSPHSRVKCVDCHIGPGASWAVKSKISGLRQVWAVLAGSFQKPIPSPVKELRPARDTCEQCHWPAKFHGNRVVFRTHFGDDQENQPAVTALLLKVGGADAKGEYHGIHWHVRPDVEVRYQALDDKREKIGRVTWIEQGQIVAEYLPEGEPGEVQEERVMDCVDCHNRPTHAYDGTPANAVDAALAAERLDRSVPFLRKLSVEVLSREDVPRDQAQEVFARELTQKYRQEHADLEVSPGAIEAAAEVLAQIYRRNIYPDMKIGWDTYPSHLGHLGEEQDIRGCFRCHNDKHKSRDGKVLSMDCDLCHEVLHEEEDPEELPDSLKALLHMGS